MLLSTQRSFMGTLAAQNVQSDEDDGRDERSNVRPTSLAGMTDNGVLKWTGFPGRTQSFQIYFSKLLFADFLIRAGSIMGTKYFAE